MTNMNYLVFIWNVFVDTLLLLIVYAWKMYDMQTLHAGGIPMFRGTYLVLTYFIYSPGVPPHMTYLWSPSYKWRLLAATYQPERGVSWICLIARHDWLVDDSAFHSESFPSGLAAPPWNSTLCLR